MKLIIEIPEEQYNDIVKYLTNNDGNYAYSDFNLREIIRNGTPYNPSGDCISRSALKGVIETYRPALIYNNKTDMKNRMVDYFLDEIDNADTVDLWQMRQEATENALKKAREADRWISVDEALPENHASVIAYDNNDVFVAWYDEGWKSSDSQFDKHTPIVAWRPIPRYTKNEKGGAE